MDKENQAEGNKPIAANGSRLVRWENCAKPVL